jgi:type II secretory pathway component PulC
MDAVMRNDSARLDPQVDATGHTTGLVVEDVGTTCLAALGFQNGDVLQTINGQAIDRANYATIYQSVYKAKNAVVRFERGGVARTVVYEIAGE